MRRARASSGLGSSKASCGSTCCVFAVKLFYEELHFPVRKVVNTAAMSNRGTEPTRWQLNI